MTYQPLDDATSDLEYSCDECGTVAELFGCDRCGADLCEPCIDQHDCEDEE